MLLLLSAIHRCLGLRPPSPCSACFESDMVKQPPAQAPWRGSRYRHLLLEAASKHLHPGAWSSSLPAPGGQVPDVVGSVLQQFWCLGRQQHDGCAYGGSCRRQDSFSATQIWSVICNSIKKCCRRGEWIPPFFIKRKMCNSMNQK